MAAERAAAAEAARLAQEEERRAAEKAKNIAALEAQRLAAAEAARLAAELETDEATDNHEADEAGVKDSERSADLKSGTSPGTKENNAGSADEVDPVALAREFARLLQESEGED
jgi:hypothetical protein